MERSKLRCRGPSTWDSQPPLQPDPVDPATFAAIAAGMPDLAGLDIRQLEDLYLIDAEGQT